MDTTTQTHRSATWRTDARLRSRAVVAGSITSTCINGNHGMKPSVIEVTTADFAPARRGAPPL